MTFLSDIDFPGIALYLSGDIASNEEHQLYTIKKINKNQLNKRVIFTGRISKDAIPEILADAAILALPRPASIQAEDGISNKIR